MLLIVFLIGQVIKEYACHLAPSEDVSSDYTMLQHSSLLSKVLWNCSPTSTASLSIWVHFTFMYIKHISLHMY